MLFERGMSGAAPSSISAASIELAGAAGGKRLGQQSEIKPCELCCVPLNYSNAGHFAAKYPPFPPATRMTPLPLLLLLLLSHHSLSGILLLSVGFHESESKNLSVCDSALMHDVSFEIRMPCRGRHPAGHACVVALWCGGGATSGLLYYGVAGACDCLCAHSLSLGPTLTQSQAAFKPLSILQPIRGTPEAQLPQNRWLNA